MLRRAVPLLAAIAAAFAAPAAAGELDWGGDIEVMAEAEMNELRGGFEVPGTNVNINFGAVVTTYVNGSPALTTNVTWTDAGAIVDQTMANVGRSLDQLSPEGRTALGLDGLDGAGGLVIEDEAGLTALVHNVTDGALQNIIINSATGRDLRQDVELTLELPGFDVIQDALTTERFGIRLGDDMRSFLD
jgi:hypothetical protein